MLSFQSCGGDSFYKISLAQEKQNDNRQYHQTGHCHNIFPDYHGFGIKGQP
jgi:hypothetical protein